MRRQLLALAFATLASTAGAEGLGHHLQLNGFATAAITALSNDFDGTYHGDHGHGVTEDFSAEAESAFGLQVDYTVNPKANLVVQLVGEGKSEYEVRAEWAYIRYALSNDVALRAGRIAFPPFLYSDSRLVGYAYPWARLPNEIYHRLDITSMDGVDLLHRQPLGDWTLSSQFVLGTGEAEEFRVHDGAGINFTLNNDVLTLRLSHINGKVSGDVTPEELPPETLLLEGSRARFNDIGLSYDDGRWFAAAEFGQFHLHGWPEDWDAGYVSVGHYFGQWLPYVLWSKTNTVSHGRDAIFLDGAADLRSRLIREQTTQAVGIRFDPLPGAAIKAQVDRISDFKGSPGLFSTVPDESSTYLYTVSLNVSF